MIEGETGYVLQACLKRAGAMWLAQNTDYIASRWVLRVNSQLLALWNLPSHFDDTRVWGKSQRTVDGFPNDV